MNTFKPFKMASYSQNWPTNTATVMHSSNPEPFSWHELEALTQLDLKQILSDCPMAYESTQGSPHLREQLISAYLPTLKTNDLALTSGAQEGIFLVINSLIEAGDEVLTFTPCFEPLVSVAQEAGADVKLLELDQNNHWSIPWQSLENAINDKTKMLIINFPHNPTGSCITPIELERLISLCEKQGIWIFSDEVFRGLEHRNQSRLQSVAELYSKSVSMGVMSKSMALPGIRLGWLATQDLKLMQRCLEIKSHLSICQSSLDAHITTHILPFTNLILKRNLSIIESNKEIVKQMLVNHSEFRCSLPHGSATAFIELTNHPAEDFCIKLLKEEHIFVMPGPAFLTDHSGFRLTLGKHQAEPIYQTIFKSDY